MASSSSAPSPSETPPTNSGATPPSSSPPPPSSSSTSPPPESSPPPPPSKESPPPPSKDSHPPPPPPKSSSPSPSPPKSDTSPPPPPANASPPPTPKSDTSAPPNSPPPPESSTTTPSLLSPPPPPPPQSIVAPSSNNSSSKKTPSSSSSGGGGSNDSLVIIVGVAAGAALLLFIMTLLFLACGRKKKKNHQQQQDNNTYYPAGGPSPASKVGTEYYLYANHPAGGFQPQNNNWVKGTPHHHVIKIQMTPPPPPPLASPQTMGLSSAPPMISSSSGEVSPSAGRPPNIGMSQSSLFTYEQLAAATANFAKANILGQGGFGYVFKGVLPDGKEVAVKTLKPGSGQGDREFQAEVEIITRVHHRYLVSLVGYCIDGPKRMLVYEFVPNKTLEYHLHANDRPVMDWPTRLKIALGSAKGLAYLHEDCHPRIIHRDIKASNILLEYNFEAKVSDFGLAKLTSDNNTHVSTRVMGTFGYLAPEYAASGKLTEKSDTFSFGVMLLELITGRRPVDTSNDVMEDSLVDWARPLIDEALVTGDYRQLLDPRLQSNYVPQELASMVVCAGACTRHSARRRPKMGQVVRALEGDLSLDVLKSWNKQQNEEGGEDSGTSSAEYGGSSYSADLRNFRRIAFEQTGYSSSEYGGTSEYGLNPSSSSSELESHEITTTTKKHPT